jgi:crotonobetainyl-CoA:carnitine CoA-transferase CaiB-like acyl-CoA transferase
MRDIDMNSPLSGLRILDLSRGPAAGLSTMILADFGAEVLVVNRSGEADPLADSPSAPMWNRGKQQISLDLNKTEACEAFESLCAGADVLVSNWRPDALKRKSLDFKSVEARHPHLIFCHITGFGSSGPLANLPGYEHVAAALAGRMNTFAGIVDRDGPVFSALQVATYACSQFATSGILAAILQRDETGKGRLVETSLLQGLLPYEQGPMIGRQFEALLGNVYGAGPSNEPPMPSLYYHPAQAGDGKWLQFGNLLPHLFDNFLMVTDLIDVIADPDWNQAQMTLPQEKHEAFRERMLLRIQERPAADWINDCIENGGVVATTYQTTQQALIDPDIVANDHAMTTTDGSTQLGTIARLTKTPGIPGQPISSGENAAIAWKKSPRKTPTTSNEALPLAGIKIVEIATIIAAPLGACFLSDMGAQVTKIEQIGGDPYRGLAKGIGSARVNAGKQSISVNLKSEAGRQIVLDLVKNADVLIHNYRPGVPERLGFGYEQVAAINPRLIYLQSNGYGPDGPGSQRPSTHPIPGAAMGGVMYQMGGRVPEELQDIENLKLWTRRMMRANEVNPDPNTAMAVQTSVMLGLVARQRTGMGQQVLMDMFGANAWANFDDFVKYPGKAPRPMLDELGHGLSSSYRLYPCADKQWIFLALIHNHEKTLFRETLESLDITCPDLLTLNNDALGELLAALFVKETADIWQARFVSKGIACVRADEVSPADFWLTSDQVRETSLTQAVTHPRWGKYQRHAAGVTFDGAQPTLAPPPFAGQHNSSLLASHGYTDADIDRLLDDGVIWSQPE